MEPPEEIVRQRPEHKAAIAELQTALWSPDPALNLRYLEWKYEHNPWAVEPRVYLAIRSGRVIGMRGFFESRWEVGVPARVVSIPLADDLTVRADERNTGLVTRIMRAALTDLAASGVEYTFSLSAGMVTAFGSLVQGWKSPLRYELLSRSDPASDRCARLRRRAERTRLLWRFAGSPLLLAPAERRPFARLDARARELSGFQLERQPRCQGMAQLVAELGHDGRLRHVRSAEYLAWRFADPLREYRFLHAPASGRLDGYLVLSKRVGSGRGVGRVVVSDLEARSEEIRTALLDAAIGAGGFPELAVWAATLRPAEKVLLAQRGFGPADPVSAARGWPCALVRSTRERAAGEWSLAERPLLDPRSWDLRMLYSMAG
jgi:hypothetical protein